MKVTMSINALRILATALVAAGLTACNKDNGPVELRQTENAPVEFSAYGSTMPTKGVSYSADEMLGHWVDSTSTYVPGTGIGVFAFYQKAKSNGYPVNFNKYSGEPNYMYNQKLERTSEDGETYSFTYSPQKYWPNNENDQLSFFAYAPYDRTTAWEDLAVQTDLNGTYIRREYRVEEEVADQSDFMWVNPHLNLQKNKVSGPVHFTFRHLCSRISVTAVSNYNPLSPIMTVDTLRFSGKFNTSGTMQYDVATSESSWKNLKKASRDVIYVPFEEEYAYNDNYGRDTSNAIRITNVESLAHPKDRYVFLLPGVQDITLHYAVSQRNPLNGDVFSLSGEKTFPAMQLEEGKAYNFKLQIELSPISIQDVVVINVDTSTIDQNIP